MRGQQPDTYVKSSNECPSFMILVVHGNELGMMSVDARCIMSTHDGYICKVHNVTQGNECMHGGSCICTG